MVLGTVHLFSNRTYSFTWTPNHVEKKLLLIEIHYSDPSLAADHELGPLSESQECYHPTTEGLQGS